MEEIWKDIGIKKYAVSNMGNVRGQDGIRILKPSTTYSGYKIVLISNNGICKSTTIHKLVMESFVGERPNGYDIDHINRIRYDNRLENLRYCTRSENSLNRCNTRTDIEESDPLLRIKLYQQKYSKQNKEKLSLYNKERYNKMKGVIL